MFAFPFPDFFQPRVGVQLLKAGNASLSYLHKHFGLRIQAKQVDPDYRALAAFYQQTDMRSVTIEPSIRLRKNKIKIKVMNIRQKQKVQLAQQSPTKQDYTWLRIDKW